MYNSQVGAVVFLCSIAFKLSSLPSIVNEFLSSSTLWFYIGLILVDTLSFVLTYLFFKDGSDEHLHKDTRYKIGLFVLMLYLSFKCIAFFSFAVLFFTVELFVGVPPFIVVSILIAPIVYIGVKGANTIARTAEIFVFIIFGVILLNLAFLDAKLDIGRNLPVFSMPAREVFAHSLRYGNWLGNLLPFIFVKIENKKFPYVSTSYASSQIVVLIVVFIGMSMYGDSMKVLSNLLIETSGFNQLSTEIGRMEWTALFAVVVMGIMEMAFLYYGVAECSVRLVGSRIPMKIMLPLVLFLLAVLLPSPQIVADFSHTEIVGAIMAILSLILPAYFLLLKLWVKKRFKDRSQSKSSIEQSNKAIMIRPKNDVLIQPNNGDDKSSVETKL